MNYLAHAYLSFSHPGILFGNLISDFVKGKKKFDYPLNIQRGITLHREIDLFTDTHPATKKAKEVFRKNYRLYSGAFVDIVYDHFLANDPKEFSESSLLDFSLRVYGTPEKNAAWMPEGFSKMFPYMKKYNWLFNYRTISGIENSFGGLVRRAAYINESETANHLFESHYQLLRGCYRHFWKDVKPFAYARYISLLSSTADNI